jgi:hypothetical protein
VVVARRLHRRLQGRLIAQRVSAFRAISLCTCRALVKAGIRSAHPHPRHLPPRGPCHWWSSGLRSPSSPLHYYLHYRLSSCSSSFATWRVPLRLPVSPGLSTRFNTTRQRCRCGVPRHLRSCQLTYHFVVRDPKLPGQTWWKARNAMAISSMRSIYGEREQSRFQGSIRGRLDLATRVPINGLFRPTRLEVAYVTSHTSATTVLSLARDTLTHPRTS